MQIRFFVTLVVSSFLLQIPVFSADWVWKYSANDTDGNIQNAIDVYGTDAGVTNIAAGAIVAADLANNSVTSNNLVDGTVDTADLTDNAVTSAKIAANTIVNSDVNSSAAIAGSKLDLINGTGRIIATSRAITYAGDTTDIMVLGGSGTNGQVVTFTQPFIGNPIVICEYAVGVGGTNAYPISVNPTNFTIGGQAATLINWIARGNR